MKSKFSFGDTKIIKIPENNNSESDYLFVSILKGVFEVAREGNTTLFPKVLEQVIKRRNKSSTDLMEIDISEFQYTSEISVELIDNPTGLKFEELRKQLKTQKYFVNHQAFIFRINRGVFWGKVSGKENVKFYIDSNTIIKFFGENVLTLEKVVGLASVKKWLKNEYLFSIQNKHLISKWGLTIPTGLLLFGLPGNGKTHFAKALSAELGSAFFILNSSEAITSSAGDGDKKIMQLFEEARKVAPSIIFIDEVEALCLTRKQTNSGFENRIATVLLNEMSGMTSNDGVLVIGATNKPDMIDFAFKRAGRFTYQIEVENPNISDKKQLFKINSSNFNFASFASKNEIQSYLISNTNDFSSAKITDIIRRAGLAAIRDNIKKPVLHLKHLKQALNEYK